MLDHCTIPTPQPARCHTAPSCRRHGCRPESHVVRPAVARRAFVMPGLIVLPPPWREAFACPALAGWLRLRGCGQSGILPKNPCLLVLPIRFSRCSLRLASRLALCLPSAVSYPKTLPSDNHVEVEGLYYIASGAVGKIRTYNVYHEGPILQTGATPPSSLPPHILLIPI